MNNPLTDKAAFLKDNKSKARARKVYDGDVTATERDADAYNVFESEADISMAENNLYGEYWFEEIMERLLTEEK